jgi:hypothetical protein
LPHAVSFGMQIKSDHLIRQVVEIQFLELHSLWDINAGLHFSWDGGSMYVCCVVQKGDDDMSLSFITATNKSKGQSKDMHTNKKLCL